MKKTINGKCYNTEFDSVCVATYKEIVDDWCRSTYCIYQKKSTGEYFEFNRWSSWKDDWDIKPISEEKAKDVIEQYWKGMTHRYVALMKSAPSLEMGCYFWGTEEDNPWNI